MRVNWKGKGNKSISNSPLTPLFKQNFSNFRLKSCSNRLANRMAYSRRPTLANQNSLAWVPRLFPLPSHPALSLCRDSSSASPLPNAPAPLRQRRPLHRCRPLSGPPPFAAKAAASSSIAGAPLSAVETATGCPLLPRTPRRRPLPTPSSTLPRSPLNATIFVSSAATASAVRLAHGSRTREPPPPPPPSASRARDPRRRRRPPHAREELPPPSASRARDPPPPSPSTSRAREPLPPSPPPSASCAGDPPSPLPSTSCARGATAAIASAVRLARGGGGSAVAVAVHLVRAKPPPSASRAGGSAAAVAVHLARGWVDEKGEERGRERRGRRKQ